MIRGYQQRTITVGLCNMRKLPAKSGFLPSNVTVISAHILFSGNGNLVTRHTVVKFQRYPQGFFNGLKHCVKFYVWAGVATFKNKMRLIFIFLFQIWVSFCHLKGLQMHRVKSSRQLDSLMWLSNMYRLKVAYRIRWGFFFLIRVSACHKKVWKN